MNIGVTKIKSKDVILIKFTSLFWIISKLISCKLWLSDRLFPVVPPFEFSPNPPNEIHLVLFISSLIGLFLVFLFTKNKAFSVFVIGIELASCFLDAMRWQPWEYQYLLLFSFYVFSKDNSKQFLQLLTFLIAVTYIYSGLHKFNGGFLYDIWEQRILKNFFHLSNSTILQPIVHYSGLLVSIIEIAIGLGLLVLKNKINTALLAIVMHLMLLVFLIGSNINPVVWPWNIAFIFYILILFFDGTTTAFKLDFFKNKFNLSIVFLIGVLPFLSFFGMWNNYLSFNLYSGNTKNIMICVKDTIHLSALRPYMLTLKQNKYCKNQISINPNNWALKELKVPICPDESTFIKLKKSWVIYYPNTESTFVMYQYPYKMDDFVEIH